MVREWSIAPSTFSLVSWEVISEAFPTRQIVHWIKLSTSVVFVYLWNKANIYVWSRILLKEGFFLLF